jgi:hypothetical protein
MDSIENQDFEIVELGTVVEEAKKAILLAVVEAAN